MFNTLHNDDCFESMKNIPTGSVDLILSDPPFGITRNPWDTPIDLTKLWAEYNRIIKSNGVIVLLSATPFDKMLGASNIENLKYEYIWVKTEATGFFMAKQRPLRKHENILVFYSQKPTYNPQFTSGKPYKYKKSGKVSGSYGTHDYHEKEWVNDGKRYPTSLLEFKKDRGLHPTQKPVALMEFLIKTYTNEGDLVLDNFMGSGSTGVAAKNLGRSFIGIEMDPTIFNLAKDRLL